MAKNGDVSLLITIPVCSFRKGYAREYLESEDAPPPSTVYGFLLSMVGEEDRYKYMGTHIALAFLKKPEKSIIIRTTWRMKNKSLPLGVGNNRSPDYQEILTGLTLAVWVNKGELAERIKAVQTKSERVERYGGLSLGESRDLVNDILWFPKWPQERGYWLIRDSQGELPLPVWVDHVGSKGTVWRQFRMEEGILETPPENDDRWITIEKTGEKI